MVRAQLRINLNFSCGESRQLPVNLGVGTQVGVTSRGKTRVLGDHHGVVVKGRRMHENILLELQIVEDWMTAKLQRRGSGNKQIKKLAIKY